MSFSLFDREELEKLAKEKDYNDKMELFFDNAREKWNKEASEVFQSAKCKYNAENAQNIVDLQATAVAYRQNLNEQVSFYIQKRIKEKNKLKIATQEKLVWYAIGKSPLNITGNFTQAQMTHIVDAHTAEVERGVILIDTYIEFLRTTAKGFADLAFQVKNSIEFLTYLTKN